MSDVIVEIEAVSKRFGEVNAVDDFSFTVEHGQVYGLLGSERRRQDDHAARADGTRAADQRGRPAVRHRGHARLPELAARRRHRRAGRVRPPPVGHAQPPVVVEGRRRAHGAMPTSTARWPSPVSATRSSARCKTYSQGMKQRLGFARLLLGRPELLVLDEPTNGLDPGEIREIRELIGRLTDDGATVLLSSHHLSEVEQVCSHVLVMNHGRLVASGTVSELVGTTRARSTSRSTIAPGPALCSSDAERVEGQMQGNGFVLEMHGGRRSDVAAAFVDAGLRLETIMPTQQLEDAFLELLGPVMPLRNRVRAPEAPS